MALTTGRNLGSFRYFRGASRVSNPNIKAPPISYQQAHSILKTSLRVFGVEIINLLCALRDEKQTTLVMATHDARVAGRAPRVMQLVDGRAQA